MIESLLFLVCLILLLYLSVKHLIDYWFNKKRCFVRQFIKENADANEE